MLNSIFVVTVLLSVLLAGFTGRMEALTQATMKSAKDAVELVLGLVGVLALFLGLMRVVADGGLLRLLTRSLKPLLKVLFPTVPPDHPAMGAMIFNIASTILGLGNAATPFGIKAMIELDRLNGAKGTASDAMIVFLAINTAGFTLIPTTIIGLRASSGSADPAGILAPTWFASACATLMGIAAAKLLARLPRFQPIALPLAKEHKIPNQEERSDTPTPPEISDQLTELELETASEDPASPRPVIVAPRWRFVSVLLFGLFFLAAACLHIMRSLRTVPTGDLLRGMLSFWVLPALIASLVLFGWARGVKVYESLVEGAKEGFKVAVRIIPYLVAILVMVGMFRASGGLDLLVRLASPLTGKIGLPAEALPVGILRPLSGSGSLGLVADILKSRGPDSFIGYMVSTIYGSTETTFYVLAVYFGAVGIKKTRHALPACLLADLAGILAAVFIVNVLFA